VGDVFSNTAEEHTASLFRLPASGLYDAEVVGKNGIYQLLCEIWRKSGPLDLWKRERDRACNEPIGYSSKNDCFKGQLWGSCKWLDFLQLFYVTDILFIPTTSAFK
jgi:hypothetical protein